MIVPLGIEEGEHALLEPNVKPFDIAGNAMKGWAMIAPEGTKDDDQLKDWNQRAVKFVGKLPGK